MLFLIVEILTLASAIAYYFQSGFAEGFVSMRTFLIFPFILGNFWAFISFFKIGWQLLVEKAKIPNPTIIIIAFLLLIFADIAFYLGSDYDSRLIAETQGKGDLILKMAQDHQKLKGSFPKTLDELASNGFSVQSPSLKGSNFTYTLRDDGTPGLTFNSVSFMLCSKSLDSHWVCDD